MKIKYFIAGLLVGTLTMIAVPTLAENDYVQALVDRTTRLEIAGEVKQLPEGYEILNYDGRTYLPTRYVAEELGSTVTWDPTARYIRISLPPPREVIKEVEVPVEVEKIVYVERDTSYGVLPMAASADNISVTLKSIYRIKGSFNETRINCEVKNNTSDSAINVDYSNATLEVDGKTYSAGDMYSSDSGFRNDIHPDNSYEGYIPFRLIDAGTKNFIFTLPIRNQSSGKMTNVTIRFSATLED